MRYLHTTIGKMTEAPKCAACLIAKAKRLPTKAPKTHIRVADRAGVLTKDNLLEFYVVVIRKSYFIRTCLPVALSTKQHRQVPTMTTFSAAAAAALDVTNSHLGKDLFGYGVILRLNVEKNGRNATPINSQLIAKMLLDEPSLVVYDTHDSRFDNDAFPSDKESFDLAFAPSTQRGSLRCYFSVTTTRSFHQLKVGVWDLLQRHHVFLDHLPGPTNKRNPPFPLAAYQEIGWCLPR
jgi:hypothetical protein